jgi:hypothetical protein
VTNAPAGRNNFYSIWRAEPNGNTRADWFSLDLSSMHVSPCWRQPRRLIHAS